MKKSNLYLLFTLAALFFLGSCSHTSQVNRVSPGKLQYAQSTPKADVNTEAIALETRATPSEIKTETSTTITAPVVAAPLETPGKKNKLASRILQKQIEKTLTKAERKITDNRVFAKVEKGKKAAQLDRNLKIAIVLIVIGAILGYLGGILGLIGWILVLIGLIFLLVWLLEAL